MHRLTANDIWNVDEIGITTMQTLVSVIAKRGSKQVGAMTTAERDQLVTLAFAVNAIGNTIPLMFVPTPSLHRPFCTRWSNKKHWKWK